jgi:hypothetical protein
MFETGIRYVTAICALSALPIVACAGGSVDRTVGAQPRGEVVISNVSGMVEVRGWDRNEVKVTGDLDEDVERVDVESSGSRTIIKVVLPRGSSNDADAVLEVLVPRESSVEVTAVSADVSSRGVLGTQRLKSVSGEVTAEVSAENSDVRSVSGDITVSGNGKPISLRASSVSGSVVLTKLAGKLDVVTVSGDAHLELGEVTDLRGRTTSGRFDLKATLAREGRVEVEAVSGDINLQVSSSAGLSTEIETFSGDINGCLAKGVERVSKYGPGSRLNIRTVEAGGYVRAKTLSGDIDICDK